MNNSEFNIELKKLITYARKEPENIPEDDWIEIITRSIKDLINQKHQYDQEQQAKLTLEAANKVESIFAQCKRDN